jgi:hypothetical protein
MLKIINNLAQHPDIVKWKRAIEKGGPRNPGEIRLPIPGSAAKDQIFSDPNRESTNAFCPSAERLFWPLEFTL